MEGEKQPGSLMRPRTASRARVKEIRPGSSSQRARVVTLTGGSHPEQIDVGNLQAERSFAGLTT